MRAKTADGSVARGSHAWSQPARPFPGCRKGHLKRQKKCVVIQVSGTHLPTALASK
jgi:hypothetical protein